MKKSTILFASALSAMLALPLLTQAQGYQVALQGAKQTGMAHIGVATKLDASATFFNPGAMALLEKNSISAGVSLISAKSSFIDAATGQKFETNNPMGTPFYLYVAWGPKGEGIASRFKFGLSVNTPFGSSVDWGKDWIGRAGLTSIKLQAFFIQPTVGFKITENLGIGAGLTYMTGSVNLQRASTLPFPAVSVAGGELDGSASGLGFNAGIYYQPIKQISLGVNFRSQVDMKVTGGTLKFSNVPDAFVQGSPLSNSIGSYLPNSATFDATLPAPQIVSFGVTVYPSEKLTLAAEMNYSGWSSYDSLRFAYTQAPNVVNGVTLRSLLAPKSASPRNYTDNLVFRFGGQYKVNAALDVRLGYAYAITPVPAGSLTPETPDNDRHNFFLGGSYKIGEKFSIDAALQFVDVVERKDTNKETKLSGTYKTNATVGSFGVSYSF
jgi:long-chain fatty acid transport protein